MLYSRFAARATVRPSARRGIIFQTFAVLLIAAAFVSAARRLSVSAVCAFVSVSRLVRGLESRAVGHSLNDDEK